MQFVVVLNIADDTLTGDQSIENACEIVNKSISRGTPVPAGVRPLSEVIAC